MLLILLGVLKAPLVVSRIFSSIETLLPPLSRTPINSDLNILLINLKQQNQDLLHLQQEQIDNLKMWIVIFLIFAFLIIVAMSFIIQSNRLLKRQNETIKSQQEEITKINKDLAIQNENLRELNIEKNTVISFVSHDLITPLTNVEGLVKLVLLNKDRLNNEQTDYLGKMIEVAQSGKELVHSMLNINKIEQEIKSVDLLSYDAIDLVKEVMLGHRILATDKGIAIHLDHAMEALSFKTDKQYFKQIISNLVSNAIKFSPPGKEVHVQINDKGETIQISVTDLGPGLSEKDKQRLFLKYEQLSNRPTGKESSTGLGLAIVKELVQKLNGKIRVESQPGAGSTFVVEFFKN